MLFGKDFAHIPWFEPSDNNPISDTDHNAATKPGNRAGPEDSDVADCFCQIKSRDRTHHQLNHAGEQRDNCPSHALERIAGDKNAREKEVKEGAYHQVLLPDVDNFFISTLNKSRNKRRAVKADAEAYQNAHNQAGYQALSDALTNTFEKRRAVILGGIGRKGNTQGKQRLG